MTIITSVDSTHIFQHLFSSQHHQAIITFKGNDNFERVRRNMRNCGRICRRRHTASPLQRATLSVSAATLFSSIFATLQCVPATLFASSKFLSLLLVLRNSYTICRWQISLFIFTFEIFDPQVGRLCQFRDISEPMQI